MTRRTQPVTRQLFLSPEARSSLLASGRAAVRRMIEPQPEGRPVGNIQEIFEPYCEHNPPGREYWVPEPWCSAVDDNGGIQWNADGNTYKILYAADDRNREVIALDDDGFRKLNKDGVESSPWESPARMPQWAARLHVSVASVWVVHDDLWFWEVHYERIILKRLSTHKVF